MAGIIGSVAVRVVPDATGFASRLTQIATEAGRDAGAGFVRQFDRSLRQINLPNGQLVAGAARSGGSSGRAFGDSFDRTVRPRIEAAIRSLPDIRLHVNSTEVDRRIVDLRTRLQFLDTQVQLGFNDRQAIRDIHQVQAELVVLQRQAANNPRLHFDIRSAQTQLTQLQAQLAGTNAQAASAGRSSGSGLGGGFGIAGLLSLLPAAIPLTSALAGAFGGAAVTAGAAAVAIAGVSREVKAGTPLGVAYSTGLQQLKGDLHSLETTGATAALSGFQKITGQINTQMPLLNRYVGAFANVAGQTGAQLTSGLLGALKQAQPVLGQVTNDFQRFIARLSAGAAGNTFARILDNISARLPQVEQFLGQVGAAVGHLITALGPIGSTYLTVLGKFADIIAGLPVGVIQTLALAFASLKIAQAIAGPIQTLGVAFRGMSGAGSAAGFSFTRLAGSATAVGGAVAIAGILFNHFAEDAQRKAENFAASAGRVRDWTQAIIDSGSATSSQVQSTIAFQIATNDLASGLGKVGVSSSGLLKIITGSQEQFDAFDKTLVKNQGNLGKTGTAFDALNHTLAGGGKGAQFQRKEIEILRDDYLKSVAAAKIFAEQYKSIQAGFTAAGLAAFRANSTAADSTARVGHEVGLTSQQVLNYAKIVGISKDAIDAGALSNGKLLDSVRGVQEAYGSADQATRGYLDALNTFSDSAGTAADKAALIGATLKASQGDALAFAGSMADAATANQNLVTGFDNAQHSAVNWKTGLIDFRNAASGPLIKNLQGLQDAATQAASATFQHELKLKGAAKAAQDAAVVFKNDTYNALIADAKQLGITSDQAQRLAGQYFQMPDSVTTTVEAVGLNNINDTLNQLGVQLSHLTGVPWVIGVTLKVTQSLAALSPELRATYIGHGTAERGSRADGGWIHGPGGPRDDKAGLYALSNKEFVVKAAAASRNGPALEAANKGARLMVAGFADGGFVNVTPSPYVTGPAKSAKAAAAAAKALVTTQQSFDYTKLPIFERALTGTTAALISAGRALVGSIATAQRHGQVSLALVRTVDAETQRLDVLAKQRDAVSARIKTANTKLAAAEKLFGDERDKVSGSIFGSFNIADAGRFGGNFASASSIVADLGNRQADASKFANQLKALAARGLDKRLLAQLAEAGPDSAGISANALAGATGGQVRQINAGFSALGRTANATGDQVATSLYGAGVQAAQGLVAGLTSQKAALARAMASLGAVLVAQIKHDLKIKSPSRVMHDIGRYTALGMQQGVEAGVPGVQAALGRLTAPTAMYAPAPGRAVSSPTFHVYETVDAHATAMAVNARMAMAHG